MTLAVKLQAVGEAVQKLDPQAKSDRIAARKLARDLKMSAFKGEPGGWRLYKAFRKAAKQAGLLQTEAHLVAGGE